MKIEYTVHAEAKFDVLKRYGINYTKSQIEEVLHNPEKIEDTMKNSSKRSEFKSFDTCDI